MNTVDPARARHDRIERWRGDRRLLVGAIVASAVTLVCGFLAGHGFGTMVEMFRTMAIDSVFDDRGDSEPPYGLVWGTFGFVGCLLAAALAGGAVRRYQGRPSGPAFPIVLAFAAITFGTGDSAREWLSPLAVGTAVDPVFHEDEKWGFWAWLMYYADRWMPLLMLVLTLLVLWYAVQVSRRYAEMVRTRDWLLAHGRRVPAQIVEVKVHLGGDESGKRAVGATVTLCFADLAGVRHWVTRRTRDTTIATAEVLFDPASPDDDKKIFVALRRCPALSDWLPAA
jgi:MFS family permease